MMTKRRLTMLLALVWAATLGATMLATASAQEDVRPVVEAARQVTADPNPTRAYIIPQLAVHPDDANTVVVAAGDYRNGGCHLWVSTDGGLVWVNTTRSLLPDQYDFCVQRPFGRAVNPTFGPDGTLYIGMSGSSLEESETPWHFPNGPERSLIAITDDLGLTHDTVEVLASRPVETETDAGTETAWEQHRHASLAFDPNDEDVVYMGWRTQTTPPPSFEGFVRGVFTVQGLRSHVAVSTDGGQTWGDPVDLTTDATGIDEPPAATDIPELEVGDDGTVYAFTKERAPGGGDGPPPANRIFMYTSTDQGASWTGKVIHPGSNRIDTPDAAIDPDTGNLYVAFQEQGESRDLPSTVYFMASEDGGETWSERITLVDPDAENTYNQYHPGISVAPNGRIDVAWWDFRDDPFFYMDEGGAHGAPNERYADVYMTWSNDGGRTWAPNMRVTDRSIDMSYGVTFTGANRGPIGIDSTDDAAYVVWPDTRNADLDTGSEDAYFTRVRFEREALVAGSGGGGDGWLWGLLGAAATLTVVGLVLFAVSRSRREESPAAA